ncbi:MAG: SDR family NAD(P)-dependent oxidoreductase [Actinomycetota bacterium]
MSGPAQDQRSERVAIVGGGGAAGDGIGNGRAAALLLARRGAAVVVVDRLAELAARTVSMIEAEGGTALAVQADVTRQDETAAVVAAAVDAYGGVDWLVNNVGVGSSGTVLDTDPTDWERVMHINVSSAFHLSRAAIPAMIRRGGGSIVNISSISAIRPTGLTAYSTSKGAVIALTTSMAVDHGPDGIRVNCVLPGPVFTPMVGGETMSQKRREARRRASVLNIEGTGWDVGNAVVFLLSDEARYITGAQLVVDGGTTLVGPTR